MTISRLGGSAVICPIWRPPGGTSRATWGQHSCLGALAATRMAQSKTRQRPRIKTKLIDCAIRCTMYDSHRLDCTLYIVQCTMYNDHQASLVTTGTTGTSSVVVNHNSLRTCNKYTSVTQLPLELHLVFPCLCLLPSLLLPAKASRLHSPSAGKRGPHGALLAEMRTTLRLV